MIIAKTNELGIDLELEFRRVPSPEELLTTVKKMAAGSVAQSRLYWKGDLTEYRSWEGKYRYRDRSLCEFFFHRPYIHGQGRVESCGNCETRSMGSFRKSSFKEIW